MLSFNLFLIFFLYLFNLNYLINSFEAIPFLQIDYNFYLKLAQCEAKCSEKFSSINKLNNDFIQLNNQEQIIGESSLILQNICQQGCLDFDSPLPPTIHQINTQPNNAFILGQQFFKQQLLVNNSTSSSFFNFFGIIRPLCVQKTIINNNSPSSTYSQEKFEAFLIFENLNEDNLKESNNFRYVVRWRRRPIINENYIEEKEEEEPQWITASIESSPRFKVSSLRPGLLYQFQVQQVSPNGIQIPAVISEWIDFNLFIYGNEINKKSLNFYSQFNSDYGVAAWVSWKLMNEKEILEKEKDIHTKPILTTRLRKHLNKQNFNKSNNISISFNNKTEEFNYNNNKQYSLISSSSFVVFPSCQLQIEWTNKSSRDIATFELDGSDGFLLNNLAFNSEYWVTLRANNNNNNSNNNIKEQQQLITTTTTTLLEGNFISMKCVQVYGFGSLECKPEPVKQLSIFTFPKNGSALIKWERPQSVENILLYEINIEAIIKSGEDSFNIKNKCKTEGELLNSKIVAAQADSTWIVLPKEELCEFEVKHTLYDLLGRDATTTIRFIYTSLTEDEEQSSFSSTKYYSLAFRQFISQLDISIFLIIFIIIFIPITALITLLCTLKRGRNNNKRNNKNKGKLLTTENNNLIIKKTKIKQNNNSKWL
ncbi:hypothetical protein Mgra_00001037 [Meloidogyne graminicola]|uniref:Fibronectin type-III domain-containing protein n=1 Tax=Meloidogyne graminicola TaxID=189291 RepID=A0A8T0A249_9BILA|nr:hypothetical protein Mgra_00001037 [Meloidogyne graminicola]